jgi:peptidoglycan hydrolase CwlO-like protein
MVLSRRTTIWSFVLGATMFVPSLARAQDNQQDRRRNFQEQFEARLKEQLGTTDDEWKVLSPKIEKVMTARRNSGGFGGFGLGGGGRGGPGGGGNRGGGGGAADDANASPVQKASRELRTALENKDTPAEEITKKLTALREAREKARAELAAAQKDLKEVLTPRQEAVLVTFGMLE